MGKALAANKCIQTDHTRRSFLTLGAAADASVMFVMKLSIFILIFIVSPISVAKEPVLTEEYRKVRTEVLKKLRSTYRECTKPIGNKYYSEFMKKCIHDPQEKTRKERCGHEAQLATERFMIKGNGNAPCKHLDSDKNDFIKELKKVVKERNIQKYVQ